MFWFLSRLALLFVVAIGLACIVSTGCQKPSDAKIEGDLPRAQAVPPEIKFAKAPETPEETEQLRGADEATPPNFGYTPDKKATEEFLRSLDKPTFNQAAPHFFQIRGPPTPRPVATLLSDYVFKLQPTWKPGSQGSLGSCVSWGWGHAVSFLLAVQIATGSSHPTEFQWAAQEAIYGGSRVQARGVSRGGYSDGSSGGAAAKWCKGWGVIWKRDYSPLTGIAEHDVRTYDVPRCRAWGNFGCGGSADTGQKLATLAKQFPIEVALVTTFDEAARAIENGYPVAVCSGQGFTSHRDDSGFARASGSWSHCMCFIGVRHDVEALLCLNSWGPTWIDGPKWPKVSSVDELSARGPPPTVAGFSQPEGSFWVVKKTAESMLRGGDSFAVSNLKGFPARKLDHASHW